MGIRLDRIPHLEQRDVLVLIGEDEEPFEAQIRFAFGQRGMPDRYVVWVHDLHQELVLEPSEVYPDE